MQHTKVIKFGGTSVGSPQRIDEVIDILAGQEGNLIVVLSAMAGTTNALSQIAQHVKQGKIPEAHADDLYKQYQKVVEEMFPRTEDQAKAIQVIDPYFARLKSLTNHAWTESVEKEILALGELISTQLVCLRCHARGIDAQVLPALDFVRLDVSGEPDLPAIKEGLSRTLETSKGGWKITQGYICLNHKGEIDNLQRGGSDYTATIIGAVLQVAEIQIWTDIDGIHNNDPRVVDRTYPIRHLSYREAAELAYFGAKILHPTCVLPAEKAQVPLRLKYTMKPDMPGTLIGRATSKRPITAIAAKDGITAVKIYSHRMLMAYGFLKRIFQIFEDHKTSIDMVTTSEVAVSVTIDRDEALPQIESALSRFAEVESKGGYTIICIVGNALYDDPAHITRIFSCLAGIPVRMVSLGGSRYNISILVKESHKDQALRSLNQLFED